MHSTYGRVAQRVANTLLAALVLIMWIGTGLTMSGCGAGAGAVPVINAPTTGRIAVQVSDDLRAWCEARQVTSLIVTFIVEKGSEGGEKIREIFGYLPLDEVVDAGEYEAGPYSLTVLMVGQVGDGDTGQNLVLPAFIRQVVVTAGESLTVRLE